MSDTRKRYSAEFKLDAVQRMQNCPNVAALAEELGIRRKFLYQWRAQFQARGLVGLSGRVGRPPGSRSRPSEPVAPPPEPASKPVRELERRVAELERQLGIKQMEVDFLKRTFEHVRGAMQNPGAGGATASTKASKPRSRSKED